MCGLIMKKIFGRTFVYCWPGTRYPEVNRKIEKLVNKMKQFPDYQDIYDLVKGCNRKYYDDKLRLGTLLTSSKSSLRDYDALVSHHADLVHVPVYRVHRARSFARVPIHVQAVRR